MASSLDRTSTSAKLMIASLASVNGPSVMVIFPPEEVMRVPTGSSPPVASSTPARLSSSMSRPISVSIFSSGGSPALVVIRNRICLPPCAAGAGEPARLLLMLRTTASEIDTPARADCDQGRPRVKKNPARVDPAAPRSKHRYRAAEQPAAQVLVRRCHAEDRFWAVYLAGWRHRGSQRLDRPVVQPGGRAGRGINDRGT